LLLQPKQTSRPAKMLINKGEFFILRSISKL
jgi:hypothetical protein